MLANVANQRAVQLQVVGREVAQVGKRCITGSKIVKCKFHTQALQRIQRAHDCRVVVQHGLLGNFKRQVRRINIGFAQRSHNAFNECSFAQLACRNIHMHHERTFNNSFVHPLACIGACLANHPVANWSDRSRLFSKFEEHRRS